MLKKIGFVILCVFAAIGAVNVTIGPSGDFPTLKSYIESITFDVNNQDHVDNVLGNEIQVGEEISSAVLNAKFAALEKKFSTQGVASSVHYSLIEEDNTSVDIIPLLPSVVLQSSDFTSGELSTSTYVLTDSNYSLYGGGSGVSLTGIYWTGSQCMVSGYLSTWFDNFTSEILRDHARIPSKNNCKLAASAIWQVDESNLTETGSGNIYFIVQ